MRHFPLLLAHELRMLAVSVATYSAAVLFLIIMGLWYFFVLQHFDDELQNDPPATLFFQIFFISVFVIVPLLTMKSLAEERRLGTMETLLTTPVTTAEVVLGKYAAAYALYLTLWGATGGFFWILKKFAGEVRVFDPWPLVGGYLFIAVSGLFFIAIGILASSLARNQAVAGILSFSMLFGLIFGGWYLGSAGWLKAEALHPLRTAVNYAQIFRHYEDFTRGVVDLRQMLFYLSGTALALIFSILSVEAKLLHG